MLEDEIEVLNGAEVHLRLRHCLLEYSRLKARLAIRLMVHLAGARGRGGREDSVVMVVVLLLVSTF